MQRVPSSETAVLVDGYSLSDGSELRGIGTYVKRIVAGLSATAGLSVSVLADAGVELPDEVARVDLRRRAPHRWSDQEHDLTLPMQLRTHKPDVFLSPAQHPPRQSSVPWIQTLHDLVPLTWPHPVLARDGHRWRRIGSRVRRAAAVAAVSRFSADEGIRLLGLDPRTVHVIPLGVDHAAFHPAPTSPPEVPYLLHVGAWGPHKGLREALAVIELLAERGSPHRLVLAGPQDDWMRSQVHAAVAASSWRERVNPAGYVEDLPGTYRGASALLVTSRCEGFGLPALEAMACGTPVIAFANSSLPEVVGDAGMLVDDGDISAMVDAVIRLDTDSDLRAELARRGPQRAARFRWQDTVASLAELLRSVA